MGEEEGSVRSREARLIFPVFPANANHYNTLFGGQLMAWMDQAAFICATRWARTKVVTAHIGAIDFRVPVPVGTMVELIARLVKVGRTSMDVQVDVWLEAMDRPERLLACQGSFVLVALGADDRPVPVPSLDSE